MFYTHRPYCEKKFPSYPTTPFASVTDVAIEGKSILKVGEDLTFKCTVDGGTAADVKWQKDNAALPSNDRYELKPNNTLVIMDAAVEDAGVYTCTYTSPEKSFEANITVGGNCRSFP